MEEHIAQGQADEARGSGFWARFDLLWSGLYLLAITIASVVGWFNEDLTMNQRLVALVLCLLLIVGHLGYQWYMRRYVDGFLGPLIVSLPYMSFIIIAWFFLVSITPSYYLILFGLFSQIFIVLPVNFASIASIIVVIIMGYNETIGSEAPLPWETTLIFVLTGLGSILLGTWITAVIKQSEERRNLLDQLQATQAELAKVEHQSGVLAERQRLAHEIHDTLAQGFISIIMHLETAEQVLPDGDTAVAKQIHQAKETARRNVQEARRVVADLRPELLENQSLPAALQRTVQRWSRNHNVTATMQTTGTPLTLHPDVDVTLLRATQEALANVLKHAQASSVSVTLSYMDDLVLLDVQDDGVGLNKAQPSPFGGGFGLEAMRERTAQFGGELLLESDPDGGTTLMVQIPVPA